MTVEFVQGDILTSGAEAITIPVNCQGVMGAGLALQAKRRWPDLAARFRVACKTYGLEPGHAWWRQQAEALVICVATKDHWKDASRMEWIEDCVRCLLINSDAFHIRTLAIPPIGCGLGGLPWPPVRDLLVGAFEMHPTHALIYGSEDEETP